MTKLMKDVFELPLRLDETWWSIYSGKKQVFKPNYNFEPEWENEANAAITAINNHDTLTEQNKQLVEALESQLNTLLGYKELMIYPLRLDDDIDNLKSLLAKHKEQI